MDWTQAFTIIGVLGGFIFWLAGRLDADIKRIDGHLNSQGARIDQLYQMFVDLLKEGRKP